LESRGPKRIDPQFFFEEEFFWKAGRGLFSFKKNAAINLRNALLLSWRCRVGTFLPVGKRFFWESRGSQADQFTIFLKKNFLESRGSRVMRRSFFFCKNKQQLTCGTRCCCRGAAPVGTFLLVGKRFFLEAAVPSGSIHNFF